MLFVRTRVLHIDVSQGVQSYKDAPQEITISVRHSLFGGHTILACIIRPTTQDFDFLLATECEMSQDILGQTKHRARIQQRLFVIDIGFTKALALESAARGITVNAVAPGYNDTAMVAAVRPVIVQLRLTV